MLRAAAVAALLLATAPAAAAEPRSLTLLTDFPTVGYAELAAVSDDGSRVLVATDARLAPGDTDASNDLYERTAAGAYVPLTDNTIGPDSEEDALLANLTPDGAVAAFTSLDRLTASDTDDAWDVYAHTPGGLVHVSDDPTGPDGPADADFGALSRDGNTIVFSTQERLATTDTDGEDDVYRWTASGLLHVSDDPTGPDLEQRALPAALSVDGRRVFFLTAESLADTDSDEALDAYELGPDGLVHLSDDPIGPDSSDGVVLGGITPDGTRVYLNTTESLAVTDTDTVQDVYERTAQGVLTHISDDPTGPDDAHEAHFFRIPGNGGDHVWFQSRERLAATDTDNRLDVYERTAAGALVHASRNPGGVEGDNDAELVAVSDHGRRLYLHTDEPLLPSDGDEVIDAYERRPDGSLRHLTDNPAGGDPNRGAFFSAASSDGSRVLITTLERMVPGDTDGVHDLYELTANGELTAISDRTDGPDGDHQAHLGALSPDGSRAYINAFDPLVSADTDDTRDLYVSALVPPPAPPAPAPPTPAPHDPDATAPRLTGVRIARGRLRFTLSERATVRVVVRGRGRVRTLTLPDRARGGHRVPLRVRRAGRYRVRLTAVDVAGNRSRPARARFRIRAR